MDRKRWEAKLSFAEAFVALSETVSVDKITVGQVVDKIGKSRKTFYYHFVDKDELIQWLFRYDLACELVVFFPEEKLLYQGADEPHAFADLPFYVRNVGPDGTINNALFFEALSRSLVKRRPYYQKLFSRVGYDTLDDYLHRIFTPCLKQDVLYLIELELAKVREIHATQLREDIEGTPAVDFLAEFYTGAFISRLIRRLYDAQANRTLDDIRPFENIIHESLHRMIQAHVAVAVSRLG